MISIVFCFFLFIHVHVHILYTSKYFVLKLIAVFTPHRVDSSYPTSCCDHGEDGYADVCYLLSPLRCIHLNRRQKSQPRESAGELLTKPIDIYTDPSRTTYVLNVIIHTQTCCIQHSYNRQHCNVLMYYNIIHM